MENAMVLLYDVCRLCLDEPGADNIFEPVDWSQDIRKCTGVKVTPADQMPQTICNNCRDILNCTRVLREIATTNDRRLQMLRDDDQNENSEQPDISSSSENRSFKNRIVFEDDRPNESLRKNEKRPKKKRKLSSSIREIESGASKTISVRTDLLSSTETVTSSTKRKSSASSSKDGNAIKAEFDHVCETCSKSYSTPKKLYLHQLTHNRKFICPLDACEKRFATRNDLQKHIRSHTGEKPFKCNLCDQSFSQNVTLKAHRENVHNEIVMSQSHR